MVVIGNLATINHMRRKKMAELFKPGEDNKPAGTYKEVGPRGGDIGKENIVNIGRGDRLPPTQTAGNKWERVQKPNKK